MTTGGMTHGNDDGHVTVFSDDKQMLFACDKGHYWIVTPDSVGDVADTKAGGGEVTSLHAGHTKLREAFGPAAFEAMGIKE